MRSGGEDRGRIMKRQGGSRNKLTGIAAVAVWRWWRVAVFALEGGHSLGKGGDRGISRS